VLASGARVHEAWPKLNDAVARNGAIRRARRPAPVHPTLDGDNTFGEIRNIKALYGGGTGPARRDGHQRRP
jgi:hypothetical protein